MPTSGENNLTNPGATPLACFRAAATGCCGAEEEEAACHKYARFPFNAHAASCLFLDPPTNNKMTKSETNTSNETNSASKLHNFI